MDKRGQILIVDDNEDILFALNLVLEPHFEKIRISPHPERLEHFIRTYHPDVILLDMNFRKDASSGNEGYYWLERIKQYDPDAVVIFITAYADMEKAVQAIKAGAVDFIPKPWEKEKLLATISSALKLRESRREVCNLREQVAAMQRTDHEIIAQSDAMLQLLETMEHLGRTDANILILGENGTGKDLVAQRLYRDSQRSNMPFVHIDMGSIPEQLFESELFGHEKGAFTDAKRSKAGRLETASGGTVFLDEIGNLSLSMQAKLLTTIEKKAIMRLGSNVSNPLNIRIISATNADIHEMVRSGAFRQDLLYRINTIELHIPPLRERGNDVLLLADFFMKRYATKYGKKITAISAMAQRKLKDYTWPGNVRELQHLIERAVILAAGDTLMPCDFALHGSSSAKNLQQTLNLEELERQAIEKALAQKDGNMNQAADLLGITRYALYRKMEKYGL
ncbi:sigma-54 dependent transcriptional regulator [Porphyromonas pogonae]|uniref:sigma-54-dependent transcriptional regulator n=1 Tax=Porphyromonas pogonae TaxID=867595 RepID=UPI002E75BE4D|nr:sigma-54 dependent transcriptional regulator [Porphyromonas pogonae]